MREYIILTDSCCDFPADMVEELGLVVQPLSFLVEGKEYFNYPDNHDMDPHVFYEKLRAGTLGTTSAVSVGVFQEAMGKRRARTSSASAFPPLSPLLTSLPASPPRT